MMDKVGALVTLELPEDSPALDLPWIITFGPLTDEDGWEPVVCGPYERSHALALAESVVADEELMAVVEPLLGHASVDDIRGEILAAKMAAEDEAVAAQASAVYGDFESAAEQDVAELTEADQYRAAPAPAPDPAQVRAGMARIGARLSGSER